MGVEVYQQNSKEQSLLYFDKYFTTICLFCALKRIGCDRNNSKMQDSKGVLTTS